VIYRDFKASNVLLDENFKPKLSDFGLAREGPVAGDTHVSTAVSATPYSVAFAYFIGIFYWLISGNFSTGDYHVGFFCGYNFITNYKLYCYHYCW